MQFVGQPLKTHFTKSVEILPGKGVSIPDLIGRRDIILDYAQMVSAPENPMGRPGIDPILALSIISTGTSLTPMPHVTPRDKNSLYIRSQIRSGLMVGISHYFVIGGDPISKDQNSKEVREVDTMGTVSLVKSVSEKYGYKSTVIGGALNPFRSNEQEIAEKKEEAGVSLFISQMCYDPDLLKKKWISKRKFGFLYGFMPITKKSQIDSLGRMGVSISDETRKRMESSDNLVSLSIKMAAEIMDSLKGYVDGIHIMPMGNERLARDIMEIL